MDRLLKKQLETIEKKEGRLNQRKGSRFVSQNVAPLSDKIEDKIPPKLKRMLEEAFYKSFQLVFEKGSKYIEMTYSKDKLQLKYDLNNYAVDRKLIKKHLNNMDRPAGISNITNSAISFVEGSALGLLGVGLADIPLFLSVVMKTVYEAALSYGYAYESDQEKYYVLHLICGAMTKEEKQKEYGSKVDLLGEELDNGTVPEISLEDQIKQTSDILSDSLLTAKFIQGLPIVGVVGGIVNYSITSKIGKYAAMKYKKRYLLKKSRQMQK